MKKVIALLVLMLVLAASIHGIGSRPSTLEISITLADGGEDVTDQFLRYVGFVPDEASGPPTLGNIKIIMPIEGHDAIYEVPPNRKIGIFVGSVAKFRRVVEEALPSCLALGAVDGNPSV